MIWWPERCRYQADERTWWVCWKKQPAAFSPFCRAHVMPVRSVRQNDCGLAGRTFLNRPTAFDIPCVSAPCGLSISSLFNTSLICTPSLPAWTCACAKRSILKKPYKPPTGKSMAQAELPNSSASNPPPSFPASKKWGSQKKLYPLKAVETYKGGTSMF